MLHRETVTAETYTLLKFIRAQKLYSEMRLVGDTALALQYGHRESEDLDFFGKSGLELSEMLEILKNQGEIKQLKNSQTIKVLSVNNTKIDFIEYNYPWIAKPVLIDGLCLAAVQDIAAMKIAAITGRGSRKDFYDLDLLLTLFSLEEILNFYTQKFSDASLYLALKSLIYFDEAEHDKDPVLLRKRAWNEVKANIEKKHLDYMKNQKS